MAKKVCAWVNDGFQVHHNFRFDSVTEAKNYFRQNFSDFATMDIYPQCEDCASLENHHDYPAARYTLTARRTVKKEIV